MLRKLIVASALVGALLAPAAPASADHCASGLGIHSGWGTGGPGFATNIHPAFCFLAIDPPPYDTRIILPGATHISVRYEVDWGVSTLPLLVDGLGFDNESLTLQRVDDPQGAYYSSGFLAIPEAGGQGEITATTVLPNGRTDTTTHHTI